MGKADTTIIWLDKIFSETMDLLEEAKAYNAYAYRRQVRHLVPVKRLEITKESLRVTSRLSHTMAWLMSEKAILNKEITRLENEEINRPLSEEEVCLSPINYDLKDCPNGLIDLMERSFNLFKRVARLEDMLRS